MITLNDSLQELTTELDGVLGSIVVLRDREKAEDICNPELLHLYKQRDRLANCVNNLRAYIEDAD